MIYDLGYMLWLDGRRDDLVIKPRAGTREHQRGLYRAIVGVVAHWEGLTQEFAPRLIGDAAPGSEIVEQAHMAGTLAVSASIAGLHKWIGNLDRWQRANWVGAVATSTGVNVGNMAPLLARSPELKASVDWAVDLIGDLNDDMRRRVRTIMLDASVRNIPRKEVEAMLRSATRMTRRRARLIARDQSEKITAKLNELQQKAAGVDGYVWQHSFRKNPRIHHVHRQGRVFKWSKPPQDGHPGHAINCRCTASALVRVKTRREEYLYANA